MPCRLPQKTKKQNSRSARRSDSLRIQSHQSTAAAETMSTHSSSTRLNSISRNGGAQTLQPTTGTMQCGQRSEIPCLDRLPALVIQVIHILARIMQCEGGREQRQDPDLYGRVVEDLHFVLWARARGGDAAVAVLELPSHSTVAYGDRHGPGQYQPGRWLAHHYQFISKKGVTCLACMIICPRTKVKLP